MSMPHTPLADQDHKLDIIEHVNDDHAEEVRVIAQAYGAHAGAAQASAARLEDIFEEGCQIGVSLPDGSHRSLFVPFALQGDLEENVLYLAYDAMVRQGKPLGGSKKQYFTVTGSEAVSPGMLRLHLQSAVPLPENAPGYAWFFSLKTLARLPQTTPVAQQRMSWFTQGINRLLLWWLKRVSPQRREKMLQSFTKDQRYYTLRHASRSSDDAPFADRAEVDVYLHTDEHGQPSSGSQWARSLRPGDIVLSNAEYHEHTDHLHQGQTVLLGDETALPTIAAILEGWRNSLPPVVFSITAHAADQAYLPDTLLPPGTRLHRISSQDGSGGEGGQGDVGQAIINILQTLPRIDAAWGALENHDAKTVRQWLRRTHALPGPANRIKGYWRRTAAGDAAAAEA